MGLYFLILVIEITTISYQILFSVLVPAWSGYDVLLRLKYEKKPVL